MQNLSKRYCQNLFSSRKFIMYSAINKFKNGTHLNEEILKFWTTSNTQKYLHSFTHNVVHQMLREFQTIRSVLSPNQIHQQQNFGELLRKLHTSSQGHNNQSSGGRSSNQSSQSNKESSENGNDKEYAATLMKLIMISVFFTCLIGYSMGKNVDKKEKPSFISWNEFIHKFLTKGEVQEVIVHTEYDWVTIVLHEDAIIDGKRSNTRYYHIVVSDAMQFEEKLREVERALGIKFGHGVLITYERRDDFFKGLISFFSFLQMLYMMYDFSKKKSIFPKDLFRGMTRAKYTLVDPLTGGGKGVRFNDVAGLKEAKIEVMEFVDYLKRPEHYKTLGAKVPKGALLLGPPGCGKTMLAKAVATEASVPFLSMNGSEFIEMIGGLGAARVRDLFKEARKRSPSILYIDEIDAIGKQRSGTSGNGGIATSESEQTLNQLLVELDGMATRDGVIILASTNRAEVLDKALLRPGRFDRHVLIDLPTLPEREEIFQQHLRNIVLEKKPETYSLRMAQLTPGFSGADIANVCNEAALHAARVKKKCVGISDLSYAIDRVLCGPEKKSHGVSPNEKRIVAYHEAGHALVAWLLEHTDALLKVTIKPTTRGALGFAQYTPTERKNFSKEQLFEMMCTLLGGRAAENIVFNRVTTGAQNDLEKVTKTAYAKIQQFGMSENIGLISFSEDETGQSKKKPYSKKLANLMDAEARRMIAKAYQAAEKLLTDNRNKLELLAEALLKQETLTYEEVERLIGPPPFGKKKKVDFIDIELLAAGGNASVDTQTVLPPNNNDSINV